MKTIVILIGFFFVSCFNAVQKEVASREVNDPKEEIYSELSLATGKLTLLNREGRCTLVYEPKIDHENRGKTETDINMMAPCNFIRQPKSNEDPLYYVYGKGAEKRTVFLITGGPPDPSAKDRFQPNGCGTVLAKVRVFENRVELVRSGEIGYPICPSYGSDEVFFGT